MISKAASDKTVFRNNLVFTKAARDAWKLILSTVKNQQGSANILLPSYIGFTEREGSGIFDPVESTGSDYSFYELNEDLSVNIDSLESLIAKGKFNVLLVVHYFGFCRSDLERIRAICQENSIVFVEDCAHAFHYGLTTEALGVTGDLSFYSIHKHLPVGSGGILKNISNKLELLELPPEDGINLEAATQLLQADYTAIRAQRVANYRLYAQHLSGVKGLEVMYELREDDIPQTFPVRIKNGLREPLYFYLMDKSLPTIALYYRLIDDLNASDYPMPNEISREILNLPVHQDTASEDIEVLTEEIKTFLAGKV